MRALNLWEQLRSQPYLLLCVLLFSGSVLSSPQPDSWSANLYTENDLFGGTDQNYTNGFRLSLISPNLDSFRKDSAVPDSINAINARLDKWFGFKEGLSRNMVASFGQLIYTPADHLDPQLITSDRPYAAYLYLGFGYHARTKNRLDSVEINVGVLGPSAQGEWAQNTVHDIRNLEKFYGWDNQLKDEVILQFVYENKRKLFNATPVFKNLEHDVIVHIGAAFGNLAIYSNVGAEYRIGWHLPKDFGTSAVRPGGDNSAPGVGDTRLSTLQQTLTGVHGFVSFDTRVVARDIFLDGNTFKASHKVTKEPAVADLRIGVSLLLKRWKLSYAQVFQTKEFEQQKHHHEYGSVSVSYSHW